MPESEDPIDAEFEAQLQGLFQQAELAMTHKPEASSGAQAVTTDAARSPAAPAEAAESPMIPPKAPMPGAIKPLVQGMEAVLRAVTENLGILKRMEAEKKPPADQGDTHTMGQLVADLRAIVEARQTVSQSMFTALHEELKGYKDGFLLQTVHRPIIRDLLTIHDDMAELHRQMGELTEELAEHQGPQGEELAAWKKARQFERNISNNLHFMLEVLARLEVTPMEPGKGKLDKVTQRAVNVEMAADPSEDGDVVKSVKVGFLWKDAVLRAEEVIIRRWKRSEPPKDATPSQQ